MKHKRWENEQVQIDLFKECRVSDPSRGGQAEIMVQGTDRRAPWYPDAAWTGPEEECDHIFQQAVSLAKKGVSPGGIEAALIEAEACPGLYPRP